MPDLRVLYVIDSLAPGGAETSLAELAPGLVSDGVDLHVLPLGSRHDLAPALRDAGAEVHDRQGARGRWGNVRAVLEVARRTSPDLIHTTLYEADVSGRTAARLLRLPSSTSIVSDSYGAQHYAETRTLALHAARVLDAATARFAGRFHATTEAVADSVAPRLHIPRDKVEVIHRGRDPEVFGFRPPGVREDTRRALTIPLDAPVILTAARLEPAKGLGHLFDALPELAARHPGVVVLLAGKDGKASPALRAAADRLDVDIRFLGHRTDVASLLAAADVFCFPSEREGFGGVLIEAMAAGCPIVATSIPATVEVLGAGDTGVGLLGPVGNAQALGRNLDTLLSDPARASSLASLGRQRFEDRFTTQAIVEQMARFLRRAAGDR